MSYPNDKGQETNDKDRGGGYGGYNKSQDPSSMGPGGAFNFKKRRRRRKKVCQFCTDKNLHPDYKDSKLMTKFIGGSGKILGRRNTGTCARHQRVVKREVKKARNIALFPYVFE